MFVLPAAACLCKSTKGQTADKGKIKKEEELAGCVRFILIEGIT